MREATFRIASSVPANLVIGLNFAQASARAHVLAPLRGKHKDGKDTRRLPFRALEQMQFKAGETIGVDGMLDRVLADALGIPQAEQAVDRKVAQEERAAKARADALKRAAKAVDTARATHAKAEKSLAKLEEQSDGAKPVPAERLAAAKRAVEVATDQVKAARATLQELEEQE